MPAACACAFAAGAVGRACAAHTAAAVDTARTAAAGSWHDKPAAIGPPQWEQACQSRPLRAATRWRLPSHRRCRPLRLHNQRRRQLWAGPNLRGCCSRSSPEEMASLGGSRRPQLLFLRLLEPSSRPRAGHRAAASRRVTAAAGRRPPRSGNAAAAWPGRSDKRREGMPAFAATLERPSGAI